jgi:hypothetical protein
VIWRNRAPQKMQPQYRRDDASLSIGGSGVRVNCQFLAATD